MGFYEELVQLAGEVGAATEPWTLTQPRPPDQQPAAMGLDTLAAVRGVLDAANATAQGAVGIQHGGALPPVPAAVAMPLLSTLGLGPLVQQAQYGGLQQQIAAGGGFPAVLPALQERIAAYQAAPEAVPGQKGMLELPFNPLTYVGNVGRGEAAARAAPEFYGGARFLPEFNLGGGLQGLAETATGMAQRPQAVAAPAASDLAANILAGREAGPRLPGLAERATMGDEALSAAIGQALGFTGGILGGAANLVPGVKWGRETAVENLGPRFAGAVNNLVRQFGAVQAAPEPGIGPVTPHVPGQDITTLQHGILSGTKPIAPEDLPTVKAAVLDNTLAEVPAADWARIRKAGRKPGGTDADAALTMHTNQAAQDYRIGNQIASEVNQPTALGQDRQLQTTLEAIQQYTANPLGGEPLRGADVLAALRAQAEELGTPVSQRPIGELRSRATGEQRNYVATIEDLPKLIEAARARGDPRIPPLPEQPVVTGTTAAGKPIEMADPYLRAAQMAFAVERYGDVFPLGLNAAGKTDVLPAVLARVKQAQTRRAGLTTEAVAPEGVAGVPPDVAPVVPPEPPPSGFPSTGPAGAPPPGAALQPAGAPGNGVPLAPPLPEAALGPGLGGVGGGVSDAMQQMLWQKVLAGDVTEGGGPSALLQAAKLLKDQGQLTSPADLRVLTEQMAAIRGSGARGPQFQAAMRQMIDQFRPTAPPPPPTARPPAGAPGVTPAPGPMGAPPSRDLAAVQEAWDLERRLTRGNRWVGGPTDTLPVDALYHGTSPRVAVEMATGFGDLRGVYLSPDRDLALGQAGQGAVLEFAPHPLLDVRPERGKPASALLEQQAGGVPPEMTVSRDALHDGGQLVRRITFDVGTLRPQSTDAVRLRGLGWVPETLPDGRVRYTNPRFAAAPEPVAPVDVAPPLVAGAAPDVVPPGAVPPGAATGLPGGAPPPPLEMPPLVTNPAATPPPTRAPQQSQFEWLTANGWQPTEGARLATQLEKAAARGVPLEPAVLQEYADARRALRIVRAESNTAAEIASAGTRLNEAHTALRDSLRALSPGERKTFDRIADDLLTQTRDAERRTARLSEELGYQPDEISGILQGSLGADYPLAYERIRGDLGKWQDTFRGLQTRYQLGDDWADQLRKIEMTGKAGRADAETLRAGRRQFGSLNPTTATEDELLTAGLVPEMSARFGDTGLNRLLDNLGAKAYRELLTAWRQQALLSPGYHAQNIFTASLHSLLYLGESGFTEGRNPWNPSDLVEMVKRSWTRSRTGEKLQPGLPDQNFTYQTGIRIPDFGAGGMPGREFAAGTGLERVPKVGRAFTLSRMMAEEIEASTRTAAFMHAALDARQAGGTRRQAYDAGMAMVNKLHFDYENTTNADELLRLAGGFHIWSTRAYPLYADILATRPGFIHLLDEYDQWATDEQKAQGLEKASRFDLAARLPGNMLTNLLLGPGGDIWINPARYMGIAQNVLGTPPEAGGITGVGKALNTAGQLGVGLNPFTRLPLQVGGVFGAQPPTPLLRTEPLAKAGFQAVTGQVPETPWDWLQRQRVQVGPFPGASQSPPITDPAYAERMRLAEMAVERTGQIAHPDYRAAAENPNSPLFQEAARQVALLQLGERGASYVGVPTMLRRGSTAEINRAEVGLPRTTAMGGNRPFEPMLRFPGGKESEPLVSSAMALAAKQQAALAAMGRGEYPWALATEQFRRAPDTGEPRPPSELEKRREAIKAAYLTAKRTGDTGRLAALLQDETNQALWKQLLSNPERFRREMALEAAPATPR